MQVVRPHRPGDPPRFHAPHPEIRWRGKRMAHEQLSFTFDPESDVIIWVELGVGTGVHACCIPFRLSISAFGTGFIRISFLSFWFTLRSSSSPPQ